MPHQQGCSHAQLAPGARPESGRAPGGTAGSAATAAASSRLIPPHPQGGVTGRAGGLGAPAVIGPGGEGGATRKKIPNQEARGRASGEALGSHWLSPRLGGAGAAREDSKRFPRRLCGGNGVGSGLWRRPPLR